MYFHINYLLSSPNENCPFIKETLQGPASSVEEGLLHNILFQLARDRFMHRDFFRRGFIRAKMSDFKSSK